MPVRRRHPWFFWTVVFLVIAIGGAGAAAYLLLRADPSWYERIAIDPARQAEGERAMRDRLATLHNEIGRSHVEVSKGASADGGEAAATFPAFEIRFTEDEVNGVIARWQENPGVRSALGEMSEPHVRFLAGRVEIAGRSASMNSLISIELSVDKPKAPDAAPTLRLGRPWAGRLPLARSLIDADAVIKKLRAGDRDLLPEPFLVALETLLRGEPVTPPIVPVSSSFSGVTLLPARVERLSIEGGALNATLRPFIVEPAATQPTARAK